MCRVAGGHIAGKKVGQGAHKRRGRVGCARRGQTGGPGPRASVKDELSRSAPMIELIQRRAPHFRSVAELVRSPRLRNDVGYMPGQVTAAFWWRQSDLFESTRSA